MSLCMGCMQEKGDMDICPHCGYAAEAEAENAAYLPPGTMLQGRYLLGKVLGQGGFGITYIGYDQTLHTRVAIKEYYPGDIAQRTPGDRTVMPYTQAENDYEHGRERFLEEARTLARFSEFPGIVSVKDCFADGNTAYMVMQFLEGINLKEYLSRKGGKVSPEEAVSILTPVMDALKEVHRAGIIHRDISPDNIFITSEGQVKLIDFGAARQSLGGGKSLSVQLKPGYAPEEQYRTHGNQGTWTDVYALAATLYRMVTGQVPPEAMERLSYDTLEIPAGLPENIRIALQMGLAVRAPERYATIEQFQNALNGNINVTVPLQREEITERLSGEKASAKNTSDKKTAMLQGVLIGTIAVLCIVLALFVWALVGRDRTPEEEVVAVQATPAPQPTPTPTPAPVFTPQPVQAAQPVEAPPVRTAPERPQPTPYDHTLDEQVLEQLVVDSTHAFVDAVNTGDLSYMVPYVDTSSAYYASQSKVAVSIHDQGIREEVLSCNLVDVEWLDNNRCHLTQHTIITCYYPDGSVRDVEETYTYLMVRSGSTFLYTQMYE